MNKRILKIAEQAYEYVDISNSGELFEEKFAEAIVRECIAQVRKDENGPAYEAAGRIAQHFGIE